MHLRAKMPGCSAPNCDIGKGGRKYPEGVSKHLFPKRNSELLATWTKALSRKDFDPANHKSAVVCSLHFKESDYTTESHHRTRSRNHGFDERNL